VNIYVGNLPYKATEAELQQVFGQHGTVSSARIIMDRETGRSKGFGFVEMPDDTQGRAAIDALNGTDLAGRALTVNEAKPKQPASGGFSGGQRSSGGW
jgi:cold-inducible RNA-binding protein